MRLSVLPTSHKYKVFQEFLKTNNFELKGLICGNEENWKMPDMIFNNFRV